MLKCVIQEITFILLISGANPIVYKIPKFTKLVTNKEMMASEDRK